jgi:hypothetical protein
MTATSAPRTLYDKIFDDHIIDKEDDGTCLLYIDRHLVHEVTSPQAFEGLRMTGRKVHAPQKTLAVVDHNIQTTDRSKGIVEEESRIQVETLAQNAADFGVEYFSERDKRQGILTQMLAPTLTASGLEAVEAEHGYLGRYVLAAEGAARVRSAAGAVAAALAGVAGGGSGCCGVAEDFGIESGARDGVGVAHKVALFGKLIGRDRLRARRGSYVSGCAAGVHSLLGERGCTG